MSMPAGAVVKLVFEAEVDGAEPERLGQRQDIGMGSHICLLYTSDAADEQ